MITCPKCGATATIHIAEVIEFRSRTEEFIFVSNMLANSLAAKRSRAVPIGR
jgi:hypothetical protein